MNLLALFKNNKMTKYESTSSDIVKETNQEKEVPAVERQYTQEELAATILRELGVSEVIISNPTAICQLTGVINKRLMDNIRFNETKINLIGNPSPAITLSAESLDDVISLMSKTLKVHPNGGVEFEVYGHNNDSIYQVVRPNGRIDNQQGIIAYKFIYEPDEDNVVVSAKGCDLRSTKVAERFEEESKKMSDYWRMRSNQWYDPAIVKTVKRTYNNSGIEMACEIVDGQTLYYFPYQFIADNKGCFDAWHINFIKQNRTKVERRTDNLGLVTVTFNDDDSEVNNKTHTYTFNTCLPLSHLPYIYVDDELEIARKSLSQGEIPITENINRAEVYDKGVEYTKRLLESEILDSINTTTCFGEQSEKIRTALREMAQRQFGYADKQYKELCKKIK